MYQQYGLNCMEVWNSKSRWFEELWMDPEYLMGGRSHVRSRKNFRIYIVQIVLMKNYILWITDYEQHSTVNSCWCIFSNWTEYVRSDARHKNPNRFSVYSIQTTVGFEKSTKMQHYKQEILHQNLSTKRRVLPYSVALKVLIFSGTELYTEELPQ